MNHSQAKQIMKLSVEIAEKLNEMILLSQDLEENEQKDFRKRLIPGLNWINTDMIMKLSHEFPSLDPDQHD